jgi:hypothetical protein
VTEFLSVQTFPRYLPPTAPCSSRSSPV